MLNLLLVGALVSCSGQRSTIGDGALQKRRHQPGWHMDLGTDRRPNLTPRLTKAEIPTQPIEVATSVQPDPTPTASVGSAVELDPWPTPVAFHVRETVVAPRHIGPLPPPLQAKADGQEPEKARWNPWAVPAFAAALGTIAYGLLGTSSWVLLAAVLATMVLSVVAVRRGRMNEWRGKGFAITGLILGTLAALITLIALLNRGF